MKLLQAILLLSLVPLFACNQVKKTQYSFNEINWTISVPDSYDIASADEVEETGNRSKKAIEYIDSTLDFSATKDLITIRKGELNYFTAAITPFDPRTQDWELSNSNVKKAIVQGFKNQTTSVSIDSSTSQIFLNNIQFGKFKLTLTYPDNNIVHILVYNRIHNGYDFGVLVCYVDDLIGKNLNQIFLNSELKK